MALAYVYDGRHKARSCHQALRRTFRDARVDLRRQVCGVGAALALKMRPTTMPSASTSKSSSFHSPDGPTKRRQTMPKLGQAMPSKDSCQPHLINRQ
jgi:hypothetical protein